MEKKRVVGEFSSVQTGVIAERLVALEILCRSGGRIVPYAPIADDDGIDMILYDKLTARTVCVQVKSRLRNSRMRAPGRVEPCLNFAIGCVAAGRSRQTLLLAVALSPDARSIACAWLFHMRDMQRLGTRKRHRGESWQIRPSSDPKSNDKYTRHRHHDFGEVVAQIVRWFDWYGSSAGEGVVRASAS